mmetsp:Transcript_1570/g.1879  ORF Transcript_1570/g.1879 Transcript_1570/m.1879 type:complete len:235 (+) Transcript_1570:1145-1849(+)
MFNNEVTRADGKAAITALFDRNTKDIDKLKLKLMFNSKSSDNLNALQDDCISYTKKNTSAIYEKSSLIDLKVHSNTGSQINPTRPPSLMIDAKSNESYISNYPKPLIVFTHLEEREFVPTQFTISSKFHREKSNADSYPVGAGLVFCTNSESIRYSEKYYHIQTSEHYHDWLAKRNEFKLPLREYEPAAFFSLDNEKEVTVTIDAARPCKYIVLMPTDFRKKPIKFTKRFHSNN